MKEITLKLTKTQEVELQILLWEHIQDVRDRVDRMSETALRGKRLLKELRPIEKIYDQLVSKGNFLVEEDDNHNYVIYNTGCRKDA